MDENQTKKSTRKQTRTIFEVAVGLLARREHSEMELARKLMQRKYSQSEIDEVLEKVKSCNYLDDERFVDAFVTSRKNRGQGPLKIKAQLQQRGVASSLIGRFVHDRDECWLDMAAEVYQKKFGTTAPEDYAAKVKAWRFMQSRGFTQDQFEHASHADLLE